jgi:cysteine desulfuration protein SufE
VSEEAILGTQNSINDIKENFKFLDDWEERYGYVIDLGKQAPTLPANYRTDDNYIHGCQSQVWFVSHYDVNNNRFYVLVDSDALIVRGLAAVVMTAFNGKSPKEIADFDMEALFQELDLLKHLSPTRGNGLRAMVQKIQNSARKLLTLH